jgi:hypothetical protein
MVRKNSQQHPCTNSPTGRATLLASIVIFDIVLGHPPMRWKNCVPNWHPAFVANEIGIPTDIPHHASYIASWIKALKDDKREIFRAAADAQRIASMELGFLIMRPRWKGNLPGYRVRRAHMVRVAAPLKNTIVISAIGSISAKLILS